MVILVQQSLDLFLEEDKDSKSILCAFFHTVQISRRFKENVHSDDFFSP